ncbi:DUF4401 domain-containing protein [Halopseudomonas salina]|uniref:DUF4401 domain-containing protein n=1 Tax=Halopseudomonas salina TaxID=1323744 RepID=A0ABQ1P084_9GAMM|nr:DUF4401 domain-containing protein [Halopseudomonas salina]GGC88453.1 hypothetical protein GCM10007418_05190 [Halopseudomonas salina]
MSGKELAKLLDQMQAQLHLDASQRERLGAGSQTPWWLSGLLGLAAWVSSVLFILSFLGPWLALIEGTVGRAVAGVLLILAAVYLFRRRQPFTNQMGLALSLTGHGLLLFVVADRLGSDPDTLRPVALLGLLIATGLLWLPSSFLHRHVCALLMLVSTGVLIGSGAALAIYGVALAALACVLWLCRQRWATHSQAQRIRALTDAATLLSLLLALMPHEQLFHHMVEFQMLEAGHWSDAIYPAGVGAVLLGVVAWLGRRTAGLEYGLALAVSALVALLSHSAPGLVLSLALALALFHAGNRTWLLLMPAFASFYLFVLYYSLHISLLHKSLLMIACGVVLLAVARFIALRARRRA